VWLNLCVVKRKFICVHCQKKKTRPRCSLKGVGWWWWWWWQEWWVTNYWGHYCNCPTNLNGHYRAQTRQWNICLQPWHMLGLLCHSLDTLFFWLGTQHFHALWNPHPYELYYFSVYCLLWKFGLFLWMECMYTIFVEMFYALNKLSWYKKKKFPLWTSFSMSLWVVRNLYLLAVNLWK
jgi:hypothetical protein